MSLVLKMEKVDLDPILECPSVSLYTGPKSHPVQAYTPFPQEYRRWLTLLLDMVRLPGPGLLSNLVQRVPYSFVGACVSLCLRGEILASCRLYVPYLREDFHFDFGDFITCSSTHSDFLSRVLLHDGVYCGPSRLPIGFRAPSHMTHLGCLEEIRGCLHLGDSSVTDISSLKSVPSLHPPMSMAQILCPVGCRELRLGRGSPVTKLSTGMCTLALGSRVVLDVDGARGVTALRCFKDGSFIDVEDVSGFWDAYSYLLTCPIPGVLDFDYGYYYYTAFEALRDYRLKPWKYV